MGCLLGETSLDGYRVSFLDIDTESLTFCHFLKEPHQTLGFYGTWGLLKGAGFTAVFIFMELTVTRPPCPPDPRTRLYI